MIYAIYIYAHHRLIFRRRPRRLRRRRRRLQHTLYTTTRLQCFGMLMNGRAVIAAGDDIAAAAAAAGAARPNVIRVAASGRRQSRYILFHAKYTYTFNTQIIIICILHTRVLAYTNWLSI